MAALKALAEPGDYEDPADVDDFADAVPVAEAGSRKQKPKATSQGMVMLIDNGDATSKGVAVRALLHADGGVVLSVPVRGAEKRHRARSLGLKAPLSLSLSGALTHVRVCVWTFCAFVRLCTCTATATRRTRWA